MPKHYKKIAANDLYYLPASELHPADTYFHFSFANYYDPKKLGYGVLRVFNDDDVRPHSGFDKHPHKDVEIVSYIVSGVLSHWDSATGIEDSLGRGSVQTITAGTGLWHSELNQQDDSTRFLQIWILPTAKDLPVRYENHQFSQSERENRLLHIVGNPSNKDVAPLHLNQSVNLYVSELTERSVSVTFNLKKGRQAYINNVEGSVNVDGFITLNERDSLEVAGPANLTFRLAEQQAHFIIIEMPASQE